MHRVIVGTAVFALAGAGCNGDPTAPGTGDFTLAVSGDVTRNVTGGAATFGTESLPFSGLRVWVLNLVVSAGGDLNGVSLVVSDPNRLGEGTYALAAVSIVEDLAAGEVGGFVTLAIEAGSPGFNGGSQSGTLTITESTNERVTGTLQLEAEGELFVQGQPPTSGSVVVSGEFDAAPRAGT